MVETSVAGKVTENNPKERTGGMANNKVVVRLVGEVIEQEFGRGFDDLAPDLKARVAEVYCKLCVEMLEALGVKTGKVAPLPMSVKRQVKVLGSVIAKLVEDGQVLTDLKAVHGEVTAVREKGATTKAQDPTVGSILDCLRKDSGNGSPLLQYPGLPFKLSFCLNNTKKY